MEARLWGAYSKLVLSPGPSGSENSKDVPPDPSATGGSDTQTMHSSLPKRSSEDSSTLHATLHTGDESYVGTVCATKITPEGIELSMEFDCAMRVLPIGAAVDTDLQDSSSASVRTSAKARLVYQEQTDETVVCRVLYTVERMQNILNVVNVREAVRIRPSHDAPIRVTLPNRVPAVIFDISILGVSILVSEDVQHLLDEWHLDMHLRLPGDDNDLVLRGRVAHRMLRGSALQYGIRFEPESCENFKYSEARILAYVLERQSELIRDRLQRRAG
jgi:hypothetical protein